MPSVTADLWPHPLTAQGRETRVVAVAPGATLADLVRDHAPGAGAVVALNGVLVPASAWATTPLPPGALVTLRPAAGDGFGRALLTIAVVAAAIYAPQLAPAAWGTGTASGAALSAGVMVVGGLVTNALVPPRLPSAPGAPAAPEPVYSLTGGANRMRPFEPLLLVLGTHRVYPDVLVSYPDFVDDEQYLRQTVDWGLGRLDIEDVRIGDTPIDSYANVTRESATVVAPGSITIVRDDVETVAGGTLAWDGEATPPAGVWVTRQASQDAARLVVGLVVRLYRLDDDGELVSSSLGVAMQYRQVGARDWIDAGSHTLSHDDQTPSRRTFPITPAAAARYEVRVRRTTAPPESSREAAEVEWAMLTVEAPPRAGGYAGRNRTALAIRATGQLSGRLDRLSGLVTQHLEFWDPAANPPGWHDTQTGFRFARENGIHIGGIQRHCSNPAWIFRWFARGVRIEDDVVAGVGLDADQIDEDALKAWGAWCDAQDLRCDLVIDRPMSQIRVLETIAQCGRATLSWAAGKLGVVWDAAGRLPTTLVTPATILAGSYRTVWSGERVADEIVATYVDRNQDWERHEVRRRTPGVPRVAATATLQLPGVTTRAQALAEVTLQAARQAYHRRRHEWEMPAGALAAVRGDVVHVTHSLIDGGLAGRLEAAGTAGAVTLDRPIALDTDARLLVRLPDGREHLAAVAASAATASDDETADVVLNPALPEPPPDEEWEPLDCVWRYYGTAGEPARVRIVAITPGDDGTVRTAGIDETPLYYEALNLPAGAALPTLARRIPRVVNAVVTERLVRAGGGFAVEITLTLTVAGDWRTAVVYDGGVRVARLLDGDTDARWIAPATGTLRLTIVPGSSAAPAGPSYRIDYEVVGVLAPPAAPTNFLIDVLPDGTRRFRWKPPPDVDLAGVQIRMAADAEEAIAWDRMTPMHAGLLAVSPWETFEPPAGQWVFAARARDTSGFWSEDDTRIVASLGDGRVADALVWECPAAEGWPGTIVGAGRSLDGRDALEAYGTYLWSDRATWQAWTSWGLGDGTQGGRSMSFAIEPHDIGVTGIDYSINWSATSAGTVVCEYRTGATKAACLAAAWAAVPNETVSGRWIQLRWTLTGDGTVQLMLDHLCWSVHAPVTRRAYHDRRWDSFAAHAGGGRLIPHDLSVVTDVNLTIQGVGAGATWRLVQKNPEVIVACYQGSASLPGATPVDVDIRGVAPRAGS